MLYPFDAFEAISPSEHDMLLSLYGAFPTTVESLVFEMIDDYKQLEFNTILAIAKDRYKKRERN